MDNLDPIDGYEMDPEWDEDIDWFTQEYPMSKFREPAYVDESGAYVTEAQLSFFLNRPNGEKLFTESSEEFLDYETDCIIHNYLFDVSESNNDEGFMFWNEKGYIDYTFPKNGKVHKALEKAGMTVDFPKDEDIK